MSSGDRPLNTWVRPPAQRSSAGAPAPAETHGLRGPRSSSAHQPPVLGPKDRGLGILLHPRPRAEVRPRRVPQSLLRRSGDGSGQRQGARSSRRAQPRVQRSPLLRTQSPTRPASSRQRSAQLCWSSGPARARHGVSQPVPLHAGPGSQRPAPHGGRFRQPWPRPWPDPSLRVAAPGSADSTPPWPPGLDPSGVLPGVGFPPALQLQVLQRPQTHRGSPRLPLQVWKGLVFRADDGGVQSTPRVRPPS
ncbi:hypothetical protein NDU88_002050 [Pleurodeles waltl]|uniref:Uncharacterized protein n=1 Tax=Pleurodeles waltl TaxID=8319 RepID=A0AAV7W260_PLEWA|nr:hypothetical protein NDU88_002050 [Pleurodeles waltl]